MISKAIVLSEKSLTVNSEAESCVIWQKLAISLLNKPYLQRPIFIYCSGPLGAGKTTSLRHFLYAMGVDKHLPIKSPTYTWYEHYPLYSDPSNQVEAAADPKTTWSDIYHWDLYRLSQSADDAALDALGFWDQCLPGALSVLEWPEKAAEHLPTPDVWIEISFISDKPNTQAQAQAQASDEEQARQCTIKAFSKEASDWLQDSMISESL